MPTYEYQCTACGERLEAEQRFTDDPLTECPKCGGVLRKVYSPVGVVFKGSGFYKNDSRSSTSKSSSDSGPAKSSDTSTPDSSSKSTTDTPTPSTPAASTPAASTTSGSDS